MTRALILLQRDQIRLVVIAVVVVVDVVDVVDVVVVDVVVDVGNH